MREPIEAVSQASRTIKEIDVLWITAGLGCDGDTIAMTAATQPSIEDVIHGQIPWIPKVTLHNPFLALANGDDFLAPFHQAAEGSMDNFILVVEGSIPNEHNKEGGYWASLGTDPQTGQPITTCEWIDRRGGYYEQAQFAEEYGAHVPAAMTAHAFGASAEQFFLPRRKVAFRLHPSRGTKKRASGYR